MKRGIVLSLVLALGGISIAAQRGNQPLDIQKVKDNLYMIVGNGGNTAAFVTDTGVVVVDTKNPGNGQAILDKIKSVTPKPVTMIINTHTHGDHVDTFRDPGFDDFILLRRIEVRRSIPQQIDAQFLGGFVRALFATDEVRIALGLGHHRDDGLASFAGRS